MITHVLTKGDAILEIEVSDDKYTMTAVFKQTCPNIYDAAEFVVTRNPNDPFELLRDIIDQGGFMDQPYFTYDGWELNEATIAKLNLPEFSLDYAVITAYPYSIKFSPMLTDRKGVAVEKTPEIIFLKPSHPCYNPETSPNNLFGKLVSWLAGKSIMYDTAQLEDYADTIGYLITRN